MAFSVRAKLLVSSVGVVVLLGVFGLLSQLIDVLRVVQVHSFDLRSQLVSQLTCSVKHFIDFILAAFIDVHEDRELLPKA